MNEEGKKLKKLFLVCIYDDCCLNVKMILLSADVVICILLIDSVLLSPCYTITSGESQFIIRVSIEGINKAE